MKKLILCLLFLQSCEDVNNSPKFKVGDCTVGIDQKETWEAPARIDKIVEIGKNKYRYAAKSTYSDTILYLDFYISLYDSISTKTDCPSYLKEIK